VPWPGRDDGRGGAPGIASRGGTPRAQRERETSPMPSAEGEQPGGLKEMDYLLPPSLRRLQPARSLR